MRDTMCEPVMELIRSLFLVSVDVRRLGSAAADVCFVACGRAAAFCEMYLSPWDYAAANLILTEAGGVVTRFDGGDVSYSSKSSILASNKASYGHVLEICKKICETYGVR